MAVLGALGLSIGSFLNVVIDRVPRDESIATRSSYCEVCHTNLGALDLVPVLSYLFLRGRCRHCGAKIPVRLALVELFTGLVFVYVGHQWGLSWTGALVLVYSVFLIVVFMIDLQRSLILNKIILPAIIIALALSPFRPNNTPDEILEVFWRSMAGGGVGFGVLLLIYIVSRGGMGAGDPKLGAFAGLIVGFPVAFAVLLMSFVGGGLVGAFLLITGRRGRKEAIPFGPFLAVSGLACLFWGNDIWDWYIDLF